MCGLPFLVRDRGRRPDCFFEIEFAPGDLRDFLPALSRQSKDLDNTSVSATDLPGGGNDAAEFVVGQDAVACDLARRVLRPSPGERSRIALATHQPKKALASFNVLLAATGAPRSTISLTSSMRSRLVISWTDREPQRSTSSRFRTRLISTAERRLETCCAM